MTIKEIRLMSGLTQAAFSKKYHIPLSTIKNWESRPESEQHRTCPTYVVELLEQAVRNNSRTIVPMHIKKTKGNKRVQNVLSTMAIENMFLDKSFVLEMLKVSNGEKTSEELRQEVLKQYAR